MVLSDVEACDWFRGGDRADAALEAANILASELKQVKAELREARAELDGFKGRMAALDAAFPDGVSWGR